MASRRYATARTTPGLAVICLFFAAVASGQSSPSEYDPLEPVNRKIFWFNDKADIYVLEPAARVWDAVFPDPVQRAVARFYANLASPVVFANDLLQGKPRAAGQDLARFLVNSTVGLAGFLDPATEWGLPAHEEDFGQTLGRWGVPAGPFLMLPLFGPSNPRDVVGMLVDWPLGVYTLFLDFPQSVGVRGVQLLNARSLVLEEVRDARRAALDPYVFVRNAYVQRREDLIRDGREQEEGPSDDIYFLDEEE